MLILYRLVYSLEVLGVPEEEVKASILIVLEHPALAERSGV